MRFVPPYPTRDQCNNNDVVFEDEDGIYRACWYPQIGGYTGKAVIGFPTGVENPCFDVWLWHDGEFPFGPEESPFEYHHCDPQQFIDFGKFVQQAIRDANV